MFVENKIYYHIHTLGKSHDELWKVGSSFKIGKSSRNFFLEYYETARIGLQFQEGTTTVTLLEVYRILDKFDPNVRTQAKEAWMQKAYKAIKEMGKYIREVIFEEVRVSQFSNLPSRKSCIWLAEERDVQFWHDSTHAGKKDVFKVQVTGDIHKGNEKFLNWDTLSHRELRYNAEQYWGGVETDAQDATNEILFEGEVVIMEKINI